jgi:hypothetical protein
MPSRLPHFLRIGRKTPRGRTFYRCGLSAFGRLRCQGVTQCRSVLGAGESPDSVELAAKGVGVGLQFSIRLGRR